MALERVFSSVFIGLGAGLLAAGCISQRQAACRLEGQPGEPVRSVDWSAVPSMGHLAQRVRDAGNSNYSRVVALLSADPRDCPAGFDIVLKPSLQGGRRGQKRLETVELNVGYFMPGATNGSPGLRDDLRSLDGTLVHEMAHVAEDCWHNAFFGWTSAPGYWVEGLADYARFRLGYSNQWSCAECGFRYPDYRSGFECAGAFLLFVEKQYGAAVIRELNSAQRRWRFSEDFFVRETGHSVGELWSQFTNTPSFNPLLAKAYELQTALGFKEGRPPKNLDAKFRSLVRSRPGGGVTLDALTWLERLRKEGGLPGFTAAEGVWMDHGERGKMPFARPAREAPDGFPATRWFYFYRVADSQSTYQYIVKRESAAAPWKLIRAWRTGAGEKLVEEYPVPH